MYKDKDKQREANKERQRRYKARQKGVTSEGVTEKALPDGDIAIAIVIKTGELPVDLELCRTCLESLPKLEKPRQYPGMCLGCVTEKYRVAKPGVPIGSTA